MNDELVGAANVRSVLYPRNGEPTILIYEKVSREDAGKLYCSILKQNCDSRTEVLDFKIRLLHTTEGYDRQRFFSTCVCRADSGEKSTKIYPQMKVFAP